ncbi:MAG: hypothetical protein IPL61_36690 [Myxococcales bacterium]|nr:hypothetical protein [Myxococcales bacterium]
MRLPALVVLAALAVPAVAAADTSNTSSIAQLMVLEPGDKNYKLFHGAVWLDIDKATTNYRWGGAQCGNREVSPSNVQLLFASFRSEYNVTLEYVVNEVKGKQYRCITGFAVSKT